MASLIATYVPRPDEADVWLRLLLLAVIGAVVVAYAKQRHGLRLATMFVLLGWLSAVLPGIVSALTSPHRWMFREATSTPDWFLDVFTYFDIGMGVAVSIAGILGGWLMLELWGVIRKSGFRLRRSGPRTN